MLQSIDNSITAINNILTSSFLNFENLLRIIERAKSLPLSLSLIYICCTTALTGQKFNLRSLSPLYNMRFSVFMWRSRARRAFSTRACFFTIQVSQIFYSTQTESAISQLLKSISKIHFRHPIAILILIKMAGAVFALG